MVAGSRPSFFRPPATSSSTEYSKIASTRMIPADVVTAQTEYSVCPRKYRLSNTLRGSACHESRGGGPGGRGAAGRRGAGVAGGTASVQMRLKTPAKSVPAAALAAATWASTPLVDCATTRSAPMDQAVAATDTMPMRYILICASQDRHCCARSRAVECYSNSMTLRSDDEWRASLTPAEFEVLREHGTEPRGSSPLNKEKRPGTFRCAGCGHSLFSSSTKFESGTGWPSFWTPLDAA